MSSSVRLKIAVWLAICCLMIFSMVALGGAVRLTGSGLSMVDWKPLLGAIPPLNQSEWLSVFEKYQNFPEYQTVNQSMGLSEFKFIFMMEYTHRLLGRLIGIVFALPFLFFLFSGKLDRRLTPRLIFLFLLGALQGLVGWYMVKSGLVNDPHVSQYRLTLHFILAVIIYSYMLRLLFGLYIFRETADQAGSGFGWLVFAVLLLMLTTGGFVAGTRAGFVFNTWPLMNGDLIPQQIFAMSPWWINLFENVSTIQFVHRWLAFVVLVLIIALALTTMRNHHHRFARLAGLLSIFTVFAQVGLGLVTLLMRVPVTIGVLHQAGALLLVTSVLFTLSLYLPPLAEQR